MRHFFLVAIIALMVTGCTTKDVQDTAAASLDVVCANLSTADQFFQSQVTPRHINATAQRAEAAAVATIASYCNARPVTNSAAALQVASTALVQIAKLAGQ